jgi:hypothetical protein
LFFQFIQLFLQAFPSMISGLILTYQILVAG